MYINSRKKTNGKCSFHSLSFSSPPPLSLSSPFKLYNMSVLNVCTTEMDRYRHHQHQRISSLYHRFYPMSNDDLSSYTSSSKNSSFEVIFSRLLDALIFTSAIAITAYSYLTGTLIDQPVSYVEAPPKPMLKKMTTRHIEDSKRRRTQEWAEQQILTQPIVPTGVASSSSKSKKKRSQSTSHIKVIIYHI